MATLRNVRDTQIAGQDEFLRNQNAMAQRNFQGQVQGFQNAYDRTRENVSSQKNAFQQSLENQYKMAQNEMNTRRGDVRTQAEETSRQAYIGKRMTERAMPEQMRRLGLGQTGFAESSAIKNEVGFQNAVNQTNRQMTQQLNVIDTELQKISSKRNEELTQAEIRYRQELMNAKSALEQNIATAGVNRDTSMLSAQGQRDMNVSNIQSTYQENVFSETQRKIEEAKAIAQANIRTQPRTQPNTQPRTQPNTQSNTQPNRNIEFERASRDLDRRISASILGKALNQNEINQLIMLEVGKLSGLSIEQKNQLLAEMRKKHSSQVNTTRPATTRPATTRPAVSQHEFER